jgi:hypothetical protein
VARSAILRPDGARPRPALFRATRPSVPAIATTVPDAEDERRIEAIRERVADRDVEAAVRFDATSIESLTGFHHLQTERPAAGGENAGEQQAGDRAGDGDPALPVELLGRALEAGQAAEDPEGDRLDAGPVASADGRVAELVDGDADEQPDGTEDTGGPRAGRRLQGGRGRARPASGRR